jgi:uncharacterized membrane protein
MSSEMDLLRSLDDEPDTPSTVDIKRAISTARRRRVRRGAGYAGAAVVTAVAVTGVSIAGGVFTRESPSSSLPIAAAPSASAVLAVAAPTSCTLKRLPAADNAPMAIIGATDGAGQYMVGRSYPSGGGYRATIWHDGTPLAVAMPGDREENLSAVNSSGTAVGFSFDASGSVPYVYKDGKVTKLPGVRHGDAYAINNAGEIVGDSEEAPVVWKSATAEPTKLPVPPGTKQARAADISEDGTIVGSIDYQRPYVWLPDGSHRELPIPSVDGKPAAIATAGYISGDWVSGVASASAGGTGAKVPGQKGKPVPFRGVRWNLSTGEVTVTAALPMAGNDVNASGWEIGTDKSGAAVLMTSSGTVTLPDLDKHTPDGLATIPNAMSDDGRTIVGQSDDKKDVIQPIVWHCK